MPSSQGFTKPPAVRHQLKCQWRIGTLPRLLVVSTKAQMAAYQYSPFSQNGIRLTTLRPGAFHDTLCIELQEVQFSLTEPPVYEALSYVWGSTEDRVPVQVSGPAGGRTHMITQNLATALRHLRFEDRLRVLWIDALCIDQSNLAERRPESEDSSLALDTISRLAPSIEIGQADPAPRPSATSGFKLNSETARTGWLVASHAEMRSIFRLISRKWFERLWICQEIALGGNASFLLCGQKEILWANFCPVMRYMYKFQVFLVEDLYAHPFRKRMSLLVKLVYLRPGVSLLDLRTDASVFKCGDPKDRVYAVLSLLHPWDQAIGITPDYSLTQSQVYRNTALAWIGHHKSLEILTTCENQAGVDLPSWAPDWAVAPAAELPLLCYSDVHHWCRRYYLPTDVDSELEALPISCKLLTTVERIAALGWLETNDFIYWLRRLFPQSVRDDSYRGKHTLIEAYYRTLCCNEIRESFFSPIVWNISEKECETVFTALLSGDYKELSDPIRQVSDFLSRVYQSFTGRCFFWGTDGYIGLAPEAARPGDRVYNILGCYAPIVLRPRSELDDRFSVVGECYIHGLMHNEGLLGDLPENVRPVICYVEGLQGLQTQYQDTTNGEVQKEDPRVLRLLDDMVSKGLYTRHDVEQIDRWGSAELLKYFCTDIQHCKLV
ncbi:heterokaryon incompatibility protein-domain-containing protein [Ustulina deusta]|nr:heterokaryon incompatibility protein-domain-containing protein [Ustulina deusta]